MRFFPKLRFKTKEEIAVEKQQATLPKVKAKEKEVKKEVVQEKKAEKKGFFSFLSRIHIKKKEEKPKEEGKNKLAKVGEKLKETTKAAMSKMPEPKLVSKIYMIIKKDINLLIRSKTSAIIFLLGPLAVFLLASMAFYTASDYSFDVGVFSDSYSPLAESVISNLSIVYNVEKAASLEDCLEQVKIGAYHVCVIFPQNLSVGSSGSKLEVYVDVSKRNIADFIVNEINKKIELQAEGISASLVTELISAIDSANSEVNSQQIKVEELKTKNAEADSKLASALTEVNGISFSSSTFDTSAVSTEIDSVVSDYNLSSNAVSDLRNKIADMKSSYDSLRGKLSDAETKTTSSKGMVEQSQSIVQTNAGALTQIKEGLGKVSTALTGVKVKNVESIVSPIGTEIKPISTKQGNLFYTFPTLVILLVTFFSLLMSATVVVREKDSKAYFRASLAPTYGIWFVIATYIANMSIVCIQGVLIFGASLILFKGGFAALGMSALVIFFVASAFIFLGTFLGYLFDSEETVMLAAICLSSIFMLFSNLILPLETMGNKVLFWIAYFNPFVVGEKLVKWFMLFGFDGFTAIWPQAAMLLIYTVLFFILSLIAQQVSKRIDQRRGV